MNRKIKIAVFFAVFVPIILAGVLAWKTRADLRPIPRSLNFQTRDIRKVQIQDRNGIPLTITYRNRWNIHDHEPLHEIPHLLKTAFVISEDRRFYEHQGVDWRARLMALFQNIRSLRAVRGASTITEQVIRLWQPRPRTIWSRWVEGFEARRLEKAFSKEEILEFYLNQVPFGSNRRGVVQGARYYFDRDPDTLNLKEILALAVMVRAPSYFDPHKGEKRLMKPMGNLSRRMIEEGAISQPDFDRCLKTPLVSRDALFTENAEHFVHHLYETTPPSHLAGVRRLRTTLSAPLQRKVQHILDQRLRDLKTKNIDNGAVLVVDHTRNEVMAWVNGGASTEAVARTWIDAITTPRQPGSTLKPFLYAMALEKGWTAATRIEDLPLMAPVGRGLHTYHNYSRIHYGDLPLRQALGNSLNTPAVRTIRFVGVGNFLNCLRHLGINSLNRHPHYYGEGLALGNGEITLLELTSAYAALANRGYYRPLNIIMGLPPHSQGEERIFSRETASIIGSILSDADARKLEFGRSSLLRFPVQTAVKTGTSNDYRDAWAVGYNDRFTVGVWTGNLDRRPSLGVTGASGPALVLRSVFAELNRNRSTRPLHVSPTLKKRAICRETGEPDNGQCATITEWFVPGTEPETRLALQQNPTGPYIKRPSPGLQLAMDPRIPDSHEAFQFQIADLPKGARILWYVDDHLSATTSVPHFLWPLTRGAHRTRARIWPVNAKLAIETPSVTFMVK